MSPRPRPLEDRFWQFVSPEPNSGCWLWEGASAKGYGVMSVDGMQTYATHVSLLLHGQPRPSPDAASCHHCDLPACVNPQHLYWGNASTNQQDALRRGRKVMPLARGEQAWNATLSDEQVREIVASTETRRELAKRFRISLRALDGILYGEGWQHITGGKRERSLASNRGERHRSAKLTVEQVRQIRASGSSAVALARELSVSPSLIYAIRAGVVWRNTT